MGRRSLSALAAVAAAVVLSACGSSGHPTTPAAAGSNAPGATPSASASATKGGAASTAPGKGAGATPGGSTGKSSSGKPATGTSPSATPSHDWTATPEELPIDANVSPACVALGSKATLNVKTKGGAAIAYVAVYAGEKSGAAPPFGYGYGGNDKGFADDHGKWSGSWTVAPNTPTGPAYVQLVVGRAGKSRQIKVPFTVAQVAGCG